MRHLLFLLLLLGLACDPVLNNGDDDDATGDDDDATGDDDDATPPPSFPGIVFAGWFQECLGECRTELSIAEGSEEAMFVTRGWENEIYVGREGFLRRDAIEEFAAIMEDAFADTLDVQYGCPDCDDGGARQITWDLGPVAVSTTYEYSNPPPVLEALDEALTAIEQEIATCVYGNWFELIPSCDPVPG